MTTSFDQDHQSAVLNFPSAGHCRAKAKLFRACLSGMEGKRLAIELPERAPVSAVVSVEYNDALFLGEVVSSRLGANGTGRRKSKWSKS